MILIVDHYDSFTYNLVQLVESLGRPTEVVKSDAESAEALVERNPDAVILSPGPGRPEDAGVFTSLLSLLPDGTPCSGCAWGTRRSGSRAAASWIARPPVHGKASLVFHEGKGILEGVTDPFEGRSLPLARRAAEDAPRRAGADGVDRGRAGDGRAAPDAPPLRRAVPPGVDPHARGPEDRRELPGALSR